MTDILDVMYRLRDMAGMAADKLRAEITEAQTVLDKLDKFANDAEDGAQLIAASDIVPTSSASIPERANLHHGRTGQSWEVGDTAHYCGTAGDLHANTSGAAHQAEMNGESAAPTDLQQGPRTVIVLHFRPKIESPSPDYIIYGQAITGWPILKATITEAPRNDTEREWLDSYLPTQVTPYGEILHAYKGGETP